MTRAYKTKTPVTISFMNRFSDLRCMKYVMTVLTFILAIRSAATTEKGPKCQPVNETDIVVSTSRTINTIAWEE
jgi:hypothetical protein